MTSLKVSRDRAENLVEWYLVKELEKHRTCEASEGVRAYFRG